MDGVVIGIIAVVDIISGRVLGPRQKGMIYVKGTSVMSPYLNNEEATKEQIRGGWRKTDWKRQKHRASLTSTGGNNNMGIGHMVLTWFNLKDYNHSVSYCVYVVNLELSDLSGRFFAAMT
ncbi:hypothetical protein NECAME_16724 [Necator americanus]|uniref:Uncharacterized protein n=1 Tax=Necator americanus TaxID=51031 RepID=W2TU35_NECAM|nr:hypothetical protein NECAME_16724 [Necator americanus]ETN85600.1 hypothetical protein NECAME_16724 [Necator americanus]